jgi:cystathionine beta-lyase/cystathionine gamma-synthase
LQFIQRAASLGGVESLCSLPILTSQYGLDDASLAQAGVTRDMMRLSIGLEDPADLIEDLRQALEPVS